MASEDVNGSWNKLLHQRRELVRAITERTTAGATINERLNNEVLKQVKLIARAKDLDHEGNNSTDQLDNHAKAALSLLDNRHFANNGNGDLYDKLAKNINVERFSIKDLRENEKLLEQKLRDLSIDISEVERSFKTMSTEWENVKNYVENLPRTDKKNNLIQKDNLVYTHLNGSFGSIKEKLKHVANLISSENELDLIADKIVGKRNEIIKKLKQEDEDAAEKIHGIIENYNNSNSP